MNSKRLILPDSRLCLFCNLRPRAGTDDLCDACSERWSTMPATVRPFVEEPRDDPPDADDDPNVLEYAIKQLLERRR